MKQKPFQTYRGLDFYRKTITYRPSDSSPLTKKVEYYLLLGEERFYASSPDALRQIADTILAAAEYVYWRHGSEPPRIVRAFWFSRRQRWYNVESGRELSRSALFPYDPVAIAKMQQFSESLVALEAQSTTLREQIEAFAETMCLPCLPATNSTGAGASAGAEAGR